MAPFFVFSIAIRGKQFTKSSAIFSSRPVADLSQMARLLGAATTPMAEAIHPKVRLQGFSPKERCRYPSRRGLSPPHETLLPGSSAEIGPRGAPRTPGDDVQTALSSHREPHPEAHASRSRPIRSRIAANSWRGTATSANWKMMYLACATTLAPILTSFSRSVVSVQPWIGFGSTSCRRKLARLYARANNCNRAALSLKRRHDSFVHFTAFLPSFIHCSAVPRRL